mmetsp:Transcript_18065/g.15996  ORF Transcript_18065/g.15996 Transcript_18065/m.15996 type:complete len:92 (-) Transcript_18065:502-777(-)
MPESPRYLYEKKRHKELRVTLKYISEINKIKLPDEYNFENETDNSQIEPPKEVELEDKNNETKPNKDLKKFSVIKELKDPVTLVNLVVVII